MNKFIESGSIAEVNEAQRRLDRRMPIVVVHHHAADAPCTCKCYKIQLNERRGSGEEPNF